MSTIKADNIATLAGVSTSMANAVNGSAKAWVNMNGTGTIAIRNSYNVSSITDNGTGEYTVTFTNPMPDVNYVVVGSSFHPTANNATFQFGRYNGSSYNPHTTASFRFCINPNYTTGSLFDAEYIDAVVFR